MRTFPQFPHLERVAFFDGQRLNATDLMAAQAYQRELRWLHQRSLHRWGIAVGLSVLGEAGDREVTIAPGYAIDSLGRDILLDDVLVVPVPPAAGEGGEIEYRLTVAYAPDDAIAPTETRDGVCEGRGAVRLREAARVAWHPAGGEREGYDLVLATAWVRNCRLSRNVTDALRRSARPLARPTVVAGHSPIRQTEWTWWPDPNNSRTAQGIQTEVDTTAGHFVTTPSYIAQVMGQRHFEGSPEQLVEGFTHVVNAIATRFTLRVTMPRNLRVGDSMLNPDAVFEAGDLRWFRLHWHVVWMTLEG